MMGTRAPQDKLFAADRIYLDFVGRDTLYGYLAENRQHLFRDEEFAALYGADNGRTSVPPSLAISILFLRAYEKVSFVEAIERTKYDLRWKVALGLEMEEVPASTNGACFPKGEFVIDLEKQEVRCPAGQTTSDYRSAGEGEGGRFVFAAAVCTACVWRGPCVRGKGPRSIAVQAEEGLQQQARAHNQTEAGRKTLRQRVVVEHRMARLVQLGIRKSRYLGRTKTYLQVVMASVVANVSLVVGYGQRQAKPAASGSAEAVAAAKTGLLGTLLVIWARIFTCPEPVWV
jgi:Transposase DDE domain/Transposase domain (DUF772)